MKYQLNQTVSYKYDDDHTRLGEVVDFNNETNRYRVYWHTEKSTRNPDWTGNPNKRTWVKSDALSLANMES